MLRIALLPEFTIIVDSIDEKNHLKKCKEFMGVGTKSYRNVVIEGILQQSMQLIRNMSVLRGKKINDLIISKNILHNCNNIMISYYEYDTFDYNTVNNLCILYRLHTIMYHLQ
ncbi:unnamed protein product [Wuchereria bancrofti]|nr:unnamed protein product [Wuchereria bancrofti]